MADVDAKLLQSDRAEDAGASDNEGAGADEEAMAAELNQRQILAKQRTAAANARAQNESGLRAKLKSKVKGIQQVMQEVSAKILKFAWTNMVESFGSAVIIVDFVVFLGLVMGNDAICKLGHEWTPKKIAKLQPAQAKAMGEKLGMVEKAGCCGLSGCWGLIIIIVISIIAAVMKVVENPVGSFFEIGWEIIKNLFGSK